MKIFKWGSGLAVRLPASIVEALELKKGDDIEIRVAGRHQLEVARTPDRHALIERLRAFRGRLLADFRFDRDEAKAR